MSGEGNKALSRRLVEEAWNQGKIEVVDETLADDFVLHDPTAPERRNRDDYKQPNWRRWKPNASAPSSG